MVIYKTVSGCRHGNQLCQYMTARIISEKLKYKLFGINRGDAEFCLNDIDLQYNQEGYKSYETPIQRIGGATESTRGSPTECIHPNIELEDIYNDTTPRKIVLDGYFQKKRFFIPHIEDIKKWYGYINYNIPKDNAIIHIRLGDLRQTNHPDLLPIEYYKQAIEMLNFNKLTICTDTPNDSEYILPLVKKYNAEIFQGNEKETICYMASHNNLILSVGTFSFWASLFSSGENIINAIPTKGNNRIDESNGVDLLIQSERHKYIKL